MKKIFLTIGGSDPCGGAGIQADIRTASALSLYPCSVISVVTAQNSLSFRNSWPVKHRELREQLKAVLDDYTPDAVKIGMLGDDAAVEIIEEFLMQFKPPYVVVDPVLSPSLKNASPSASLIKAYATSLFPHATLVTPNIPEKDVMENILGTDLVHLCNAVLIKGGHGDDDEVIDKLLYWSEEAGEDAMPNGQTEALETADYLAVSSSPFPTMEPHPLASLQRAGYHKRTNWNLVTEEFRHDRIPTNHTHGSGCVLSSAIACFLAEGLPLAEAVTKGIDFVASIMKLSSNEKLCKGNYGPLLI